MGSVIQNHSYCSFSRRQWDGLIKAWKKRIHSWDNPTPSGESQSEPVSESEASFDWSQDVEDEKARDEVGSGPMESDDVGEAAGERSKFWSERKFLKPGDENSASN